MNKRIKVIAEEAGFRSNPNIYDRNQSFDIKQFAELLIKECADLVDNVLEQGSPPNPTLGEQLVAYFEVEEYQPPVYETHCPHGTLVEKYCKNCDIEVSAQLGRAVPDLSAEKRALFSGIEFNFIIDDEQKSVDDPCPDCGSQLKCAPGGGVKCSCGYWFCY